MQAEFHTLFLIFSTIISLIGLLSYYIIFSRIRISSFDINNSSFNESVSIIICAKNEIQNIKKFFPYWINQKYIDFELIIVNDQSSDGSYEYLTELETYHSNLRVIHIDKKTENDVELLELKGKRYALRKGILASKNNYILLTDADCKPKSDLWIKEMTKGFSNKKTEIVLGFSPYFKEKTILNKFIQIETTITALHYLSFAQMGIPYMGVGRNIAYKKSILSDKNFIESNKSISGDDDLIVQQLANKNNTEYIISKNSIVESIPSKSYSEWFKQKKRHLSAGIYYSAKLKILLNAFPILFIVSISNIFMFFYDDLILGTVIVVTYFISLLYILNKVKLTK